MGPLATLDHSMDDGKNLRLDAYLKPNHDFNETSGKLRLAVRFLECPQYHEIPSREDLSRDEVSSMWYSESEYNYMKTVNVATLRLMMSASGQDMNESIYCTRGLEVRTTEGWENRHRNKQLMKNAVFQEQDMQRSERVYDDELFSRVAEDASYLARKQALERGQEDERESHQINSTNHPEQELLQDIEMDTPDQLSDEEAEIETETQTQGSYFSYFSFL